MSIEQMEYMLALEQEKKISYAARRCFISQPALSQQLAKIEKELGTSLFTRQNNEYIPTEEGRLLLDSFQKILYIYHSAIHDLERLHSVSEKCITLGMPTLRAATLYTYIYYQFRQEFPEYDMRLLEIPVTSTLDMLEAQKLGHDRTLRAFSDIAVLCRTHRQLELVERCLQHDDIPCVVRGREDFLDDRRVRGALAQRRVLPPHLGQRLHPLRLQAQVRQGGLPALRRLRRGQDHRGEQPELEGLLGEL